MTLSRTPRSWGVRDTTVGSLVESGRLLAIVNQSSAGELEGIRKTRPYRAVQSFYRRAHSPRNLPSMAVA